MFCNKMHHKEFRSSNFADMNQFSVRKTLNRIYIKDKKGNLYTSKHKTIQNFKTAVNEKNIYCNDGNIINIKKIGRFVNQKTTGKFIELIYQISYKQEIATIRLTNRKDAHLSTTATIDFYDGMKSKKTLKSVLPYKTRNQMYLNLYGIGTESHTTNSVLYDIENRMIERQQNHLHDTINIDRAQENLNVNISEYCLVMGYTGKYGNSTTPHHTVMSYENKIPDYLVIAYICCQLYNSTFFEK